MARLSRVSARGVTQIAGAMNERDWEVLTFVSAVRLASGKQLATGIFHADRDSQPGRARVARKHLKQLSDWRMIEAIGIRAVGGVRGGSATLIYGVGPVGARVLARRGFRQKRLSTPGSHYVAHTLACTQVGVDLLIAQSLGELELIETQYEPRCWRTFIGPHGQLVTLKPDLFVRLALPGSAHEYRAMIELDLATEAPATIRGKAERHLSYLHDGSELREHGVHPRIIWTVPDERREGQIRAVLDRLTDDEGLFAICRTEQLVEFCNREARA